SPNLRNPPNLSFIPFYPLSFCLHLFTDPYLSFILSLLSFRGTHPSSLILYPSSFRNASLAKIHQSRRLRFASHSVLRDQPSCLKPFTLLGYGQTQESGLTIGRRRGEWDSSQFS